MTDCDVRFTNLWRVMQPTHQCSTVGLCKYSYINPCKLCGKLRMSAANASRQFIVWPGLWN